MSGQPQLWDRVVGALRPVPPTRVPLGRYQIPVGEQGCAIAGEPVTPGAYLATGGKRWTLRRGGDRWAGTFGNTPTPSAMVMESVAVVARTVAELRGARAPLSQWTAVPPLVSKVPERLRPRPLENQLRLAMRSLQMVCREPHARLRIEHVLLPVSRARRITWRTVVHLAGHSETWAARRLHGVEPAELLTPVQIADFDLYENRVVSTLLDKLWRHVQKWLGEMDDIGSMIEQAEELMKQAESRPGWREKGRLYSFISELLADESLPERVRQRRRELLALRDALAPLLTSELRAGVRGPYTGPPRLRSTNLFDEEVNYRRCRRLWDEEVAEQHSADGAAEPVAAVAAWCHDFAQYALVLVLRALEQLGLVPSSSERVAHGPEPGRPGPAYTYRGHAVRLDWNHDDTFTLLVDDKPALRLVPLPHAMTAKGDANEIDRHREGLLRSLATSSPSADRIAVLYPGDRPERDALPLDQRLAVHSASTRPGSPAMVPVSPSDLGSMGRVARAVRGALDERIMLAYPARVPCRIADADSLARRLDWLTWRDGDLLVTRPPRSHELAQIGSAVATLRTHGDLARQQGDNQAALNQLHDDLEAAAASVTRLTCCPVCLRQPADPTVAFAARRDDTYRCRCAYAGCKTVWEIRRCLSCEQRYPLLATSRLADQPGGPGDLLDERFAQDLLAVPCWQNARSYICGFCGHCPEAAGGDCDRCSLASNRPGAG